MIVPLYKDSACTALKSQIEVRTAYRVTLFYSAVLHMQYNNKPLWACRVNDNIVDVTVLKKYHDCVQAAYEMTCSINQINACKSKMFNTLEPRGGQSWGSIIRTHSVIQCYFQSCSPFQHNALMGHTVETNLETIFTSIRTEWQVVTDNLMFRVRAGVLGSSSGCFRFKENSEYYEQIFRELGMLTEYGNESTRLYWCILERFSTEDEL